MNVLIAAPTVPNPVVSADPGVIFGQIINALLLFGGAFAVLFVMIGGFRYILSFGNAENVDKARQTVLYAILGLLIIFLAYLAIAYILNDLLQVSPAYRLNEA